MTAEAAEAAARATADAATDRRVLHAIAERPESCTSRDRIRDRIGGSAATVREAVDRCVIRGWLAPPERQRQPYTLTPAGMAVVESTPTDSDSLRLDSDSTDSESDDSPPLGGVGVGLDPTDSEGVSPTRREGGGTA